MTELPHNPESRERKEDPELRAIGERLGVIVDVLGFEETGDIAAARAAFVESVERAGGYDPVLTDHVALLDAYYAAANQWLTSHADPEARLGFEVALLRLWLDCDDPYEFEKQLDRRGDTGVAAMLYEARLDVCLGDLLAIVDDLNALNTNNA